MHNPAPTHKLLWDFNIQTDHLIQARPHNNQQKKKEKKICKIVDFAVPAGLEEKKGKYQEN